VLAAKVRDDLGDDRVTVREITRCSSATTDPAECFASHTAGFSSVVHLVLECGGLARQ